MRPLAALTICLFGCATAQVPGGGGGMGDKQRLVNLVSFDVAVCWPPVESVGAVGDGAIVTGVLLAARPSIIECLVGPGSRGTSPDTRVVVDATLDASGPRVLASGDNLTASGKACIEGAVTQAPWKALGRGARPVAGSITVVHGAASPSVRFGVNEASDVAGKVRLAMKDWCDCFTLVGDNAPPDLEARLTVRKGRVASASFDHGEGKLAGCVLPRLQAMDFLASAQELVIPIPLLLLNSQASAESATAPPDLQFSQLDAIRGRRASKLAMAVGARNMAVVAYDALVAAFKRKATAVTFKQLKESCANMVRADDNVIDANQKQLEVEDRARALAQALAGKDNAWAHAARAAQTQVDAARADLTKAQSARTADVAVCPKETY